MIKSQAIELKKAINKEHRYPTYYSSKAQTLSVRVYEYINDKYDTELEKQCIVNLLNKITKLEQRPRYEIKRRTYQGFIHDTDIIFY